MTSAAEVSILNNTQLMYFIGSLIALLLGIIGFYTVRYFNSQDKKNEKFYTKLEELSSAITALTIHLQQNSKDHDTIDRKICNIETDLRIVQNDIINLKR